MDVADQLDISPYEALLGTVRQAAGRVAWTEMQLQAALAAHLEDGGTPDRPSQQVKWWVKESRTERGLLAKTAKMSVDAGVAKALVQRLELEGAAVADAVVAALDALELDPDDRMRALEAAQRRLLAIGDGSDD